MDEWVSFVVGLGMNPDLNQPFVGSFVTLPAGLQNIVFIDRCFFIVLFINIMKLTRGMTADAVRSTLRTQCNGFAMDGT